MFTTKAGRAAKRRALRGDARWGLSMLSGVLGCTAAATPSVGSQHHALQAGTMASTQPVPDAATPRVIATGLESPWDITFGPDRWLWITERVGLRVLRMDPETGETSTALTLNNAHQSAGQDGLLGLALHPDLLRQRGHDYVYLAYTYDADASDALARRARIVRYRYDAATEQLVEPISLLEGLSASNDHNSGRVVYGPDDKLYYTIGDQGHNQFDNKCLPIAAQVLPTAAQITAQDWSSYQGKVLRLNLDGSIPEDNPVLDGVRSHIYSYGHRNPQGLSFGPAGQLYVAEHGPKSDDEVNRIQAGGNYGWPHVAGYQDDKAYVYGNWSASAPTPCSALAFSDYDFPADVPQQAESSWSHPDFRPPLVTFYTVPKDHEFQVPGCEDAYFICWPTIGPSSLSFYGDHGPGGIRSFRRSLLITSLKEGAVFRIRLNARGDAVVGEHEVLFETTNRYRDLAVAPDGHHFYIVTDNAGATSGPTTGVTMTLEHEGAVLEFIR